MCTSLQSNRGNKRDKDNKGVVGATRAVLVRRSAFLRPFSIQVHVHVHVHFDVLVSKESIHEDGTTVLVFGIYSWQTLCMQPHAKLVVRSSVWPRARSPRCQR